MHTQILKHSPLPQANPFADTYQCWYGKKTYVRGLEHVDTQTNIPVKRWAAKTSRGGPADTDATVCRTRSHEIPRNTGYGVRKVDGEFPAGTGLVAVGAAVVPTHLVFGKACGVKPIDSGSFEGSWAWRVPYLPTRVTCKTAHPVGTGFLDNGQVEKRRAIVAMELSRGYIFQRRHLQCMGPSSFCPSFG